MIETLVTLYSTSHRGRLIGSCFVLFAILKVGMEVPTILGTWVIPSTVMEGTVDVWTSFAANTPTKEFALYLEALVVLIIPRIVHFLSANFVCLLPFRGMVMGGTAARLMSVLDIILAQQTEELVGMVTC
jgi:hypothetical protein